MEEGEPGTTVFLLLDGVLAVEVGGEEVAQLGPGAVVGERALFEGGRRTATLTAVTPVRVVEAREEDLEPAILRELTEGHRREGG
jgi:CRP-like cAMP-binding protein